MEEKLKQLKKLRRFCESKAEEALLNNNESEAKTFKEEARKYDEEIGNILATFSFKK